MASIFQIGNENLLTVTTANLEDDLLRLATTPGTTIVAVGEQSHLFDSGATPMVTVENKRLKMRLTVAASLAAKFALYPKQ